MFKKVLIGLGCIFTFIALIIIGVNVYTGYKAAEYDKTAIPYIEASISEISKWDKDIFYKHLASEAKKDINQEKMEKIFQLFSKMGPLISYEEPEFTKVQSYVVKNGETRSIITYDVNAKYENGDALLTFTLIGKSETLELFYFNLESMTLLK